MQLDEKTYKELDAIFKFDTNPLEKYKTVSKAREALEKGEWGESNLLIPKDHIDKWFELAVDALKLGKRVIVINTFNPHYRYWFTNVWPWASKVILYVKNTIVFKGYENPCPKTVSLILFDPQQRNSPRKDLIHDYVDGKFEYFTIPLKVKKDEV